MEKNLIGTNLVAQVGILVHDIEKSSQDFANLLGIDVPGWSWTGELADAQTNYRGNPTEARAKLAFFPVGDNLTLELIEPDNNPSTWREDLDKNGEGIHHLAFYIKGMKQTVKKLEANGISLIQTGEYPGGRYAYMDARGTLKTLIELLENDN